jgi:predicted DNA-binding protein (MmcQ/YjbR family)
VRWRKHGYRCNPKADQRILHSGTASLKSGPRGGPRAWQAVAKLGLPPKMSGPGKAGYLVSITCKRRAAQNERAAQFHHRLPGVWLNREHTVWILDSSLPSIRLRPLLSSSHALALRLLLGSRFLVRIG